jgi:transcriptional regulator, TetR family
VSARDTRRRILAVAREAFARGGYETTSVRSIATRAGVDQALVHRYFGTKQQLFLASLELPVDPEVVLAPVVSPPVSSWGRPSSVRSSTCGTPRRNPSSCPWSAR